MSYMITEEEAAVLCECCGHKASSYEYVLDRDGGYWGHRVERTVCEYCIDSNDYYQRCECCDEYYDTRRYASYWNGRYICTDCEDNYCECNNCGEVVLTDDARWSDYHDAWYCDSCGVPVSSSEIEYVNEYYFKPEPVFNKCDDENNTYSLRYFGAEWEIDGDCDTDAEGCSYDLYGECCSQDLFYQKHDGSLDGANGNTDIGIEVVTHPCTLKYHMEQFPWRKITNIAKLYNYRDDTDTCGFHIHVNRVSLGDDKNERDLTIAKMIIMMDRFWEHMMRVSGRNDHNIRWCNRSVTDWQEDDDEKIAIEKSKNSSMGRYRAINIDNTYTVEFRLWNGTLDLDTIRAYFYMTDYFCTFAKENDLKRCMKISWSDFRDECPYEEAKDYIRMMGE